jgi:hypothetical protein
MAGGIQKCVPEKENNKTSRLPHVFEFLFFIFIFWHVRDGTLHTCCTAGLHVQP